MLWILLCLLTFACSDARCMYRPPNELVPKDLVYGVEGVIDDYGHYESQVVFDWSKAVPYYFYRVVESIPAKDTTNVSLGSTNAHQSDERTPLAIFTRTPGAHIDDDEPIDNFNTYRLTVEVYSDCNMGKSITQATYIIDLKATYEFRHNYTEANALLTTNGWHQPPRIVMHPDVHRELHHEIRVNRMRFIKIRSSVDFLGDENETCAGDINAPGQACYILLNITFERIVENIPNKLLQPISVSYALSQFSQSGTNASALFNDTKPDDFNVSRIEPVESGYDYRYDICEGVIDTGGNAVTRARSDTVEQHHSTSLHTIQATCKYRVFADRVHFSPVAYFIGWIDYEDNDLYHSLLGGSTHMISP